jgi:CRP-like cAMP-binding protein
VSQNPGQTCMCGEARAQPLANGLLESLSAAEQQHIAAFSTRVHFAQYDAIYRANDPIESVYLLEAGMVSFLTIGKDGRAIETGAVGREGVVGGDIVFRAAASNSEAAIVLIPGAALRMPAELFLRSYETLPALATLVDRQIELLLFEARQNALCRALHSCESRFCRWLLRVSDTVGSDVVDVTQGVCSQFLGVQRTTLSMVAHALQNAGGIRTIRGKIKIVDRTKLESTACECYLNVRERIAAAPQPAGGLKGVM